MNYQVLKPMAKKVRIDKWLWSVRIFKTRTVAINSIKSGKVKINGTTAKPSNLLSGDELVEVHKGGFNFSFRVLELIEKRVSASLAEPCYRDETPMEEKMKYENWFTGKAAPERREKGTGRPTKRERRDIDDFKSLYIYDWDEE